MFICCCFFSLFLFFLKADNDSWSPRPNFSIQQLPLRLYLNFCFANANMASANLEACVLQELTCPVCLDLFRDPHLLPCGHNFCKSCLHHLKQQAERGRLRCPECRNSHRSTTSFQKNFKLANIADDYRQRRRTPSSAPARATALMPRDSLLALAGSHSSRGVTAVPCDYCPSVGSKASGGGAAQDIPPAASALQGAGDGVAAAPPTTFAVKTCLKCEVSMCQEHIKPHLELPAFCEHPLTDPINDFWRRKCPAHDEIYR